MSNQIRDGVVGDLDKAGVYFSANDAVLEWVYPFLESFREFNPELPLILIPFNDAYSRLAKLGSRYRFDILIDPSLLELDEIGRQVIGHNVPLKPHYFRRYAAFSGPLQRFIYLDSDILVLARLSGILEGLRSSKASFIYFDGCVHDAYLPGDLWNEMIRERKNFEFNAGAWASRRGVLTIEDMRDFADRQQSVNQQLNLVNGDQPFINFICHSKPLLYSHVRELDATLSQGTTNWIRDVKWKGGKYVRWQPGIDDHCRPTLFLHFPGTRQPFPLMKFRKLYLRYRLKSEPLMARIRIRANWAIAMLRHRIEKYLLRPTN